MQIDNVARICALIRRLFGEFVFVLVQNKLQFRDIVFCHFERRSRAAESEESVFVGREYHVPALFVYDVVVNVIPIEITHARLYPFIHHSGLTAGEHD